MWQLQRLRCSCGPQLAKVCRLHSSNTVRGVENYFAGQVKYRCFSSEGHVTAAEVAPQLWVPSGLGVLTG